MGRALGCRKDLYAAQKRAVDLRDDLRDSGRDGPPRPRPIQVVAPSTFLRSNRTAQPPSNFAVAHVIGSGAARPDFATGPASKLAAADAVDPQRPSSASHSTLPPDRS